MELCPTNFSYTFFLKENSLKLHVAVNLKIFNTVRYDSIIPASVIKMCWHNASINMQVILEHMSELNQRATMLVAGRIIQLCKQVSH